MHSYDGAQIPSFAAQNFHRNAMEMHKLAKHKQNSLYLLNGKKTDSYNFHTRSSFLFS